MRLMPLRSPAMQRMDVYTHFWFVPNRLIWENWQELITLGPDGLIRYRKVSHIHLEVHFALLKLLIALRQILIAKLL